MFQYYPNSKRQILECHTSKSPRAKKARISKSKIMTLFIVFFYNRRLIHEEFEPPGRTTTPFSTKKSCTESSNGNDRKLPIAEQATTIGNFVITTTFQAFVVSADRGCNLTSATVQPRCEPGSHFPISRVQKKSEDTVSKMLPAFMWLSQSLWENFKVAFATWKSHWHQRIYTQGDYFEEFNNMYSFDQ